MMDLFNNLWSMGGDAGAASAAPTSMEQIKVQPQAMDLAGTIPAANAQLDFNATEPGTDWGALGKMGLMAVAQGSGGKQQQQQPMMQPQQYRGGRAPEDFKAEDLSGMNMAALQKFSQVPGLLGKR